MGLNAFLKKTPESDDVIVVTSPDDVMYGEDLEGEVIAAGALPAQAHAGKSPCTNQSFMNKMLSIYLHVNIYILSPKNVFRSNPFS